LNKIKNSFELIGKLSEIFINNNYNLISLDIISLFTIASALES